MIYFITYHAGSGEPFQGQISNLTSRLEAKEIRCVYSKDSIFIKLAWSFLCVVMLNKPQGFMFLGLGYSFYDQNNIKINKKTINFSSRDTLIWMNQTAPRELFKISNGARMIRWTDLSLDKLLTQRYSLWGVPLYLLRIRERKLLKLCENKYTNKYYSNDIALVNSVIVHRSISKDFLENRWERSIDVNSLAIVYIGGDHKRKRLNDIVKIMHKLNQKINTKLYIFGVKKDNLAHLNMDKNIKIYGVMSKKDIVKNILLIKAKAMINITCTVEEGAPIVMLELQSLGVVCYALDNSGPMEYLLDYKNSASNCNEMINKISRLYLDPKKCALLMDLSVEFGLKHSPRNIIKELLQVSS
jgi:glycosyltransferase involved in cell wall biosynthesis